MPIVGFVIFFNKAGILFNQVVEILDLELWKKLSGEVKRIMIRIFVHFQRLQGCRRYRNAGVVTVAKNGYIVIKQEKK